ncbi:DUF3035 domain-containing protein [Loktanella agnita]|uniref:DUF3035 domain-containing protein n=1 Tax=Loktanella agnita TaxID=287097 RepID=UPI00398941A9
MRSITFLILAVTLMTACGDTDRPLRDMRASGGGPDEFQVIPVRPLEMPATFSLPEPTPGGSNRTDPTPNTDAIAALGGRPSAQVAGGIPTGDAALVAQSGRYGVDPAIRSQLAAEDARILERKRRTNVFNPLNRDRYFPAYAGQALDASAEQARLRALGVAVPVRPVAARPQPRTQPESTAEAPAEKEEAGLLQRTLAPIFQSAPRDVEGEPMECIWTTAGPGNELRRVCTPVTPEEE